MRGIERVGASGERSLSTWVVGIGWLAEIGVGLVGGCGAFAGRASECLASREASVSSGVRAARGVTLDPWWGYNVPLPNVAQETGRKFPL